MKKGNFGSLFCTSSLAYSIDVRKAAGSASFIFVECPAICSAPGVSARLRPRGHRLADFMHVAGLEQLLRRFPLRLGALRGNRLMRVLLNRGGGHVDTFGRASWRKAARYSETVTNWQPSQ